MSAYSSPVSSRSLFVGRSLFSSVLPCALAVLGLVGTTQLTGCATGVAASAGDTALPAFSGKVHGGQQPVSGATIQLYATTSGGYGGAANLLGTTVTDASGNFLFTPTLSCSGGQQAYVIASGGNPGIPVAKGELATNNAALMMMAAIGPCTGLGAGTLVDINEVSTVAAAYALSGFLPAGGAGFVTGNITGGVSTSSTNVQGMNDAFANAANIVNLNSGYAYTATAAAGSTGVVPQAAIYSLADIIQDCVNSTGTTGAGTACGTLFTNATPPSGSGVAAPVNTLQAMIDIATFPGNNVSALYSEISANAAFLPNLGSTGQPGAPNDWTLGIVYTNPQLNAAGATTTGAPTGLTIDATDNVWVSGATNASLVEFSPLGAILSPAVGTGANGQGGWTPSITTNAFAMGTPVTTANNVRNIAFDQTGNIWLADGNATQIYEYTPGGTATAPGAGTLTTQSYGAVNTDGNNYDLAIDGSGNVWTTSYKQSTCGTTTKLCAYIEFAKSGSTYTAAGTFGGSTFTQPSGARGVAANAKAGSAGLGDIWATNNAGNTVQIFQSPYTTSPVVATVGASTTSSPYGVALDAGGNGWIATGVSNQLFQVSRGGAVLTTVPATGTTAELNKPFYLAIDGNGNIFLANSLGAAGAPTGGPFTSVTPGANTVSEYSPSLNAFLSPNTGFAPGAVYNSSTASVSGGVINNDSYVAVDRAGALWVLSSGAAGVSYTPAGASSASTSPSFPANLVQILGVAAPTNPVQAAGQYGVKP